MKALADQCVAEAGAAGISRQKLEEEFGGLSSYMHGELERLSDEEVAKGGG